MKAGCATLIVSLEIDLARFSVKKLPRSGKISTPVRKRVVSKFYRYLENWLFRARCRTISFKSAKRKTKYSEGMSIEFKLNL